MAEPIAASALTLFFFSSVFFSSATTFSFLAISTATSAFALAVLAASASLPSTSGFPVGYDAAAIASDATFCSASARTYLVFAYAAALDAVSLEAFRAY